MLGKEVLTFLSIFLTVPKVLTLLHSDTWCFLHKPFSFIPLRRESPITMTFTFCSEPFLSSFSTKLLEDKLLLLQLQLFFYYFWVLCHYLY